MSRLTGLPRSIVNRISTLEIMLAVNTLRDIIEAGWSYLGMTTGIADEFTDETGVAVKTNATYDAAGKYYHGPMAYGANLCTTGQTIYGNQDASYTALRAFDGNNSTAALSLIGGSLSDCWVGQNFGTIKAVRRIVARFNADGDADIAGVGFLAYAAEYSDDGSAWTLAHAFTLAASLADQVVDLPYVGWHQHWRIRATAGSATGGVRGKYPDITMHEATGYPAMRIESINTHYGSTAPVAARLIIVANSPFAGTPYVSRDGGSNWAASTFVGAWGLDAGRTAYAFDFDLTGVAANNYMRWRVDTTNQYYHVLSGAWLQWRLP